MAGGYRSPAATFAAEVFEDVGYIVNESQEPSVLSYLAYSSLNYWMTRRFSNGKLLAETAISRTPSVSRNIQTLDQFRLLIHRASLLLLAERFEELRATTDSEITRELAQSMLERVSVQELTPGLLTLRSLNKFARFVRENRQELLDGAMVDLERGRESRAK